MIHLPTLRKYHIGRKKRRVKYIQEIKMKRKKAQISGQVFIYILALIIFSGVLLYGYKAVKMFGEQSEELIITQMTNEIRTQVGKIESQYEYVEKLQLAVPENYEKVCFIDTRIEAGVGCAKRPSFDCIWENLPGDFEVEKYPLICDSWKDCTGENMFLIEGSSAEGYNIGALAVKPAADGARFFCVDVTVPKTIFRLRGTGEYAEISPW